MEKFLALPIEKQLNILESAMSIFALYGYKKTSIQDISDKANISKSMIFYYFGTKKELYLFLVSVVNDEILGKIDNDEKMNTNDFFDKLIFATDNKFKVLAKYPSSIKFLSSFYIERDEEVFQNILEIINLSFQKRDKYLNHEIDKSKFKDSIDIDLVQTLVTKIAEGYSSIFTSGGTMELDKLQKEFHDIMYMLRDNFYKEEFL